MMYSVVYECVSIHVCEHSGQRRMFMVVCV